jgi:hypothetical protein
VDLASGPTSTAVSDVGLGTGRDVELGTGRDDGCRVVADADTVTDVPVELAHAVAPMVIVANNAATITIVVGWSRRGLRLTTGRCSGRRSISGSADADACRR